MEAIKNWGAVQKVTSDVCALWWYKYDLDLSFQSVEEKEEGRNVDVSYKMKESSVENLIKTVRYTYKQVFNANECESVSVGTVYYIEGCHDAYRLRSPLYIGKAGGDSAERLRVQRGSLGWFFYVDSEGEGRRRMMWDAADTWDITVRWAFVVEKGVDSKLKCIDKVEKTMIRYHKPVYNTNDRKGPLDFDLTVLNVGAKGTMLPVCASRYFAASNKWPAETDPEVDIANSPE